LLNDGIYTPFNLSLIAKSILFAKKNLIFFDLQNLLIL